MTDDERKRASSNEAEARRSVTITMLLPPPDLIAQQVEMNRLIDAARWGESPQQPKL
jgi:hypothetical protein